jgi:hypothetical protein
VISVKTPSAMLIATTCNELSPSALSAVNAFAYLLLEILTEPNDVYSTKYNAMFKAMDHHVVYGSGSTSFS